MFYLHGAILEGTSGRAVSQKFGVYEYEKILRAFARQGFTVISELRRRGTAPEKHAARVAGQVDALIKAGVAPQRITVVGASRGGGIALIASTLLRNRELNFVIIASCAGSPFFKKLDLTSTETSSRFMIATTTPEHAVVRDSLRNRRASIDIGR